MLDADVTARLLEMIAIGVVLEALLFVAWLRRRHRPVGGLIANLTAAVFLVLAVRTAMAAAWLAVWLCLTGALVAHGLELRLRLRSEAAPQRQ